MKQRHSVRRHPGRAGAGIHILDTGKPSARAAEHLQAAGLLAAGIAHDFNNLLGVILGYCELLITKQELCQSARAMIGEIHNAGSAGRSLAQSLLAFSSGQTYPPLCVDVNACVRRMGSLLSSMLGEGVELEQQLVASPGIIEAQPGQLEQVLINLAINARDAMHQGGKLSIATANTYLDETYGSQHPGIRPGHYVKLTVTDTGAGMDTVTQARMFEPFFTTKAHGQGTGLGLSTVACIVKNSAGTIDVDSALNCGTTITIHFPVAQQTTHRASTEHAARMATGAATILLVEDEPSLRALTCRILEGAGYAVLEAASPQDALCQAQNAPEPISLLITDILMPGLNGFELARTLTALHPETAVLFMSGRHDSRNNPVHAPAASHAFLEKPFTRERLLNTVTEALRPEVRLAVRGPASPGFNGLAAWPPRKPPLACG